MLRSLVGSEMCIRDRWYQRRVHGVAKRLENACYTENPKSRKGYDRFMTATTSGLKNIRKMKYLSLRFMELNYDLDYIYQFKDMEIETLQKQNDRTKEDMIQKLSLIHI
eukprot:TRINITY_DN1910_c0_g1_i5.p1 TRINITY_DN1910_c0_g1~~TRINITY_DN1910_c0_g1_i5.p1  ORF type:complete len:109 (+),score=43.84 TRINITY_DN1910_c0_g1_i5:52-378(+)